MSNTISFQLIRDQLSRYKKKYYLNSLIRGAIFFVATISVLYLIITGLEYFGRFSTLVRASLLFIFLLISLASVYQWILIPIFKVFSLKKGISDEDAARQIGLAFPEINDKLLNALQLNSLNQSQNDLIQASILQRIENLKWYKFRGAIRFSENKRFVKYLIAPASLVALILLFIPELFSEGTERLINYKKSYVPQAPYEITILNDTLTTFRNDDFNLELKFSGNIPENAFLLSDNRKIRLKKESLQNYSYTWRKLQKDEFFKIEAAGFISREYVLRVLLKPDISSFQIQLDYPNYTGLESDILENTGDISAPVGTKMKWIINTKDAESIEIKSEQLDISKEEQVQNDFWSYGIDIVKSFAYSFALKSKENIKRDILEYRVKAIEDEYPQIQVKQHYDTLLYDYIIVGGEILDDYGFTSLTLKYKVYDSENNIRTQESLKLKLSEGLKRQNYIYNWSLDSIGLQSEERLEYYIEVSDNDGYLGPKSTKSNPLILELPNRRDLDKKMNENSNSLTMDLSSLQEKAKELNEELKEIMDDTKSKKELEWKDKNKIENALKKHEELKKQIEELNKTLEKNIQSEKRFNKQSDEIQKKTESLRDLMSQILDEETKELLKELQKLLEEKTPNSQIQNKLENLENKSFNMEKELDRALEMFKQLQFESQMEKAIEKLDDLAEKQEKLSEQNKDKSLSDNDLKNKQEEINNSFDELKEDLANLKKLDESMEEPNGMEDTNEEEKEIEESLQESQENLQKNKNNKASESQKKSSEQMKNLSKKLSDFMMSMESQSLMEDINNLRNILENLITLSFDQEEVMKEFKKVNQTDPRYVELGQEQLKLKDDAKIIEDSLLALAKRVFQIESFVTREVNEMNKNIDDALDAIKERKNGLAAAKQQFAMTSINNLALMLNDVLKQMQEQMASQMEGDQMCTKPKKSGKSSMSQMQQGLNQKIRDLKKSGKQGRELSEELSELAREQEELRKMLEGLGDGESQLDKNAQDKLNELSKIMEDSEKDLVHKRLTQELLERQEDILTRLLESEKADREQQMDPNREAQSADQLNRDLPPDLSKFFQEKDKQTELLKTISPFLNSYYRDRVNDYFEKIYE